LVESCFAPLNVDLHAAGCQGVRPVAVKQYSHLPGHGSELELLGQSRLIDSFTRQSLPNNLTNAALVTKIDTPPSHLLAARDPLVEWTVAAIFFSLDGLAEETVRNAPGLLPSPPRSFSENAASADRRLAGSGAWHRVVSHGPR